MAHTHIGWRREGGVSLQRLEERPVTFIELGGILHPDHIAALCEQPDLGHDDSARPDNQIAAAEWSISTYI